MKTPEEILENNLDGWSENPDLLNKYSDNVLEAIKQAQIDAYNEALEDAIENVEEIPDPEQDLRLQYCDCIQYVVDKQSILKLKK